MEFIAKIILTFAGNLTALLLTTYIDPDFAVTTDVPHLIKIVAVLALANLTLRPILQAIFRPLIALTFSYFNIIINAAILYTIDIYSNSLTINGLWALLIGAHAVGLIITLIDYSSALVYSTGEIE